MSHLQRLLDRFLACRPTGSAKNSRPVLVAMYPVVMRLMLARARPRKLMSLSRFIIGARIQGLQGLRYTQKFKESYWRLRSVATPENYTPPPPLPEPAEPPKPQKQQETGDLVDLREEAVSADDQGNRFTLALFAGPAAKTGNGSWEAFPTNGKPEVTSAWQTPVVERQIGNWP
ncbi:ENTH/ANTH/VHS superfamily protein [Actinidia rufa]|uniref:ENTH/ANTH/VHS superfamily protein n=1 Tax=Actinidia rufa TaxID=165716 RepID=A0A7J0DUL1_9ERIC|nr:ENTH/ANTH/VHS superfamily protein [Actinidia rufa]